MLSKNPRESANFFSILLFYWTLPLFRKGYTKILELDDLFRPLNADQSQILGDRLEKTLTILSNDNHAEKPSLLKAIWKTFWKEYLLLAILCLINDVLLRLVQPQLLRQFLLYFTHDSTISHRDAIIYASLMVTVNAIGALTINQLFITGYHNGMKVRVAVCSIIYRKALRLSQSALGDTAPGKIVNLLSNDVNRFDSMSMFCNSLWTGPLLVVIITYLLWMEVQWAGMMGLLIVFIVVPIQSYTGKLSSKYRNQTANRTDERVRFMDEIISGIQVIKMYAWERPFTKLISLARKFELKVIRKSSYIRALYMTFALFTTRMALFCTMLSLVLLYRHGEITAARIFVVSSYFNVLSQMMSQMFVRGIAEIAEALVAIKRLQNFLNYQEKAASYLKAPESNEIAHSEEDEEVEYRNVVISVKKLSARWISIQSSSAHNMLDSCASDKEKEADVIKCHLNGLKDLVCDNLINPTLYDISVDFKRGKLIGIVGPVGSGKSSILQVLLRELPIDTGTINVSGTISYAGQEPWLFGGTIRQNILFNQPMQRSRYNSVIKVCALLDDLENFEYGDMTVIGERGVSLSGGQRARINLARAIYKKVDIYLLDDPLSAVDSHVGRHLFNECIGPRGILARQNATRILVTHQVHFLKVADWVVVLRNGSVAFQGEPRTLYETNNEFASFIDTEFEKAEEKDNMKRRKISRTSTISISNTSLNSEYEGIRRDSEFIPGALEIETVQNLEASSRGTVKGSLLKHYFMSGGHPIELFVIFILFVMAQIMASAADYWVSFWTAQEESRSYNCSDDLNKNILSKQYLPLNSSVRYNTTSQPMDTNSCVYIYTVLILSVFLIAILRSVGFYNVCNRASQKLHDNMFKGLVSATMQFFNTNPSGRILNRFAKDMGVIDELLPRVLLDAIQTNLNMTGAILLTSVVNPLFLIPIFLIILIFFCARKIYLKTSKNIKRLEGITKSPVFTHLSLTLNGLATIRANNAENFLINEFDNHQDIHTACWFMFISTSSAFGFSLDIMCFIFVFLVTFSFILIDVDARGDKVGLAITQAMTMTGLLQWGIRHSVEVSNQLMSVERILEYSNLEPEQQMNTTISAPKMWPFNGKIEFRQVTLKYFSSAEPVLRNLSFTINAKEKIGIVGRTGAGKSSLIGTIFRLTHIDEGDILIDDIDTSTLSLQDLRSKIAIIPQDPVLFSGSLRINLDPFEEYSDDEIWRCLAEVELKDLANGVMGLQTPVMAHGINFSVGQRQLLCLARAILRKNKILVMDEATANVDPETDSLIQKTIRSKFAECTVLTVAHRLHTIIDSDRILVMDMGKALELDTPHNLLQKKVGVFKDMVLALGPQESEHLRKLAQSQFELLNQ